MNIFTEREPVYVVAMLAAILGWLVTTIHEDIGRLPVLEYQFRVVDGQDTLVLRNISRSQSVSGTFLLRCVTREEDRPCFQYDNESDGGALVQIPSRPPFWIQNVEATARPRLITMTFSLPATARFDVPLGLAENAGLDDLVFLYAPDPAPPSNASADSDASADSIVIVERSAYSRVVANYDRILVSALLLTVALLLLAFLGRIVICIFQRNKTRCGQRGG